MTRRSTKSKTVDAPHVTNTLDCNPPGSPLSRTAEPTTRGTSHVNDGTASANNAPALGGRTSSQPSSTPELNTRVATAQTAPSNARTAAHVNITAGAQQPGLTNLQLPPRTTTATGASATPSTGPHARRVVLGDITDAFVPPQRARGRSTWMKTLGTRRSGEEGALAVGTSERVHAPAPRIHEEYSPVCEEYDQRNEFEVWVEAHDDNERGEDRLPTTIEDQAVAVPDVNERICLSDTSASNESEKHTAAPTSEPASNTNDLASEVSEDDGGDEEDGDKENEAASVYPPCLHPHREVYRTVRPPPPAPVFLAPPPATVAPAPAPAPLPTCLFPFLPGTLSIAAVRIDELIAAGAHPSANQLRMRAEDADLRALIEKERRRRGAGWAVSPMSSDDEGYDSDSEEDSEWELSELSESEESSSDEDSSDDEDLAAEEAYAVPSSPGKRKRELEEGTERQKRARS